MEKSYNVIHSWLVVALAGTFLWSIAWGNFLFLLILLLWLWDGRFDAKWQLIKANPVAVAALLLVGVSLLGLLWTEDWDNTWEVLRDRLKFLLVPVLLTTLLPRHVPYAFLALVTSMLLLVLLSYGLYLGWLPLFDMFKPDGPKDTTPFIHHIVYGPVLALTVYLLLYVAILRPDVAKPWRYAALVLAAFMGLNLFLTEGRMGQLVFLALLALLVFQYYRGHFAKAALLALLLVGSLAPAAYWLSPVVKQRVDQAVHEVQHYRTDPESSVGLRLVMLLNSWELIRQHPLLGVGTGDYVQEYATVNQRTFPQAQRGIELKHPHNVYVQEWVQTGIPGLAVLLYFLYTMVRSWGRENSPYRPILLAIPLFYAVIFWSDGYLGNHYLLTLLLLLLAALYRNHDRNPA